MAVNFFSGEILYQTYLKELQTVPAIKNQSLLGDIEHSSAVSGIELRLLPPHIKENGTPPVLFFPGKASLYCLVIVVSDADNQLAGGFDLQGFPRIGDHEHLPVNKTIYYWQALQKQSKPPTQVHAFCSVVKSKKGLRQAGEIISQIKDDAGYKSIAGTIALMAAKATPVTVALDMVTDIAQVVGKYLKNVEDKPLGSIINSYTVLHGDFDKLGISKLSYTTPKVNFEMELTVRDKKREKQQSGSILGKSFKQPLAENVVTDLIPII